ncbi:MAG: isoleucine--tRNA ligase [Candidatus Omnitrophota bacterium]|nr:isoleucine--tRNA ligase [Candidatus Omnitrophota bacterium]
MDYKPTLNLPKTDFPMKAELAKREPAILEAWNNEDIYRLIQEKSKGRPKYILHDGPPYANGDIHIGHALNKTLKDIIVKYKSMRSFSSAYVPGWDCHGLPVEHQLFKELKINKYQISQLDFRKKAYDYAMRYVSIQKEQFKRLGVFGDWENPYLTLSPDYEAAILDSLAELVKKGYIYHGLKPVNWCFKCETALAEAEVEYEDCASPSIYVRFKLEDNQGTNTYLVIWTTTPWTLLANVAVSVHPDFIYSFIKTENGNLIFAKELLENALLNIGIKEYELIKELKGRDLEGYIYEHPFGLRRGRVVLADYVSKEEGTGLVHTAPGHGNEDYWTGLKYKLDIIMPVDPKGNFDSSVPEFKDQNCLEANKKIIEKLFSGGNLLFHGSLRHSYPHCWRCKTPIIFRATKQWFLRIDHLDLRKELLLAIKNDVKWIPEAGKERIASMLDLRPDWCLSRQRYWGVPIPALVCKDCGNEILLPSVISNFAGFSVKEGSDCWFSREIEDFLSPGFKCPNCESDKFSKGTDILDVWFDSGVSHQAVLKKRKDLNFPCALYLEGSDQHRGWFQSSIITSTGIDDKPPFKNVLTHGFVVDADGRKMSKSLGNVISPFDIIKEFGADILRMWVASSDYNEDIRISQEILKRLSEAYRKIRNTVRFILSNLYDFNPDTDKVDYAGLKKIDKWILFKLQETLDTAGASYESFQFHKAYKGIYDFCNTELSMYYLDMVKGRLYTFGARSLERRAAQTVIYETLIVLVRIMAPILIFTSEEIWSNMLKEKKDSSVKSVHLLDWPLVNPVFSQALLRQGSSDIGHELKPIFEIMPSITAALEDKRTQGLIGSSFDAKINLLTNSEFRYKYLCSLKDELPEIFKVSQVEIIKDSSLGESADIVIEVSKADGLKCPRCWNFFVSAIEGKELCVRCAGAIGE